MSNGRITQQSVANVALRGLQSNLANMQNLQQALSSGKKISQPSDDPAGTVSSMTLRSRQAADNQYQRNIQQATGRLNVTDNSLTQLNDRLTAVRNLVVQSRDGSLGSDSKAAISAEITSIRGEVLDLYNTTYLDRPVFGGTTAGSTAVDASGAYVGDNGAVSVRISADAVVPIDVAGTAVGADTVPAMLAQVATNVTSPAGASDTDLANLDAALSKVSQTQGDVGARESRIDTTKNMLDSSQIDLTTRISANEDVDIAQATMNLSSAQLGYQAALASAAKIQQTSLVDFLK
jgi:flagellar hook-associated protein 3 FlgL